MQPKVAFLTSSKYPLPKMQTAWEMLYQINPEVAGAGPMSMREAIRVGANIYIHPSLVDGNPDYKFIERLLGAVALGPALWGTLPAISDASRGVDWWTFMQMAVHIGNRVLTDSTNFIKKPTTSSSSAILVNNAGSTSLKWKVFDMPLEIVVGGGNIQNIGEANSDIKNHAQAVDMVLDDLPQVLKKISATGVIAVGHRVVNGGRFNCSMIIDEAVIAEIERCCDIAPKHNPPALWTMRRIMERLGKEIPNVAVFDTSFHTTIPERARTYAIKRSLAQQFNIYRAGFHGTNHRYVATEAAKHPQINKPLEQLKLITCHLGGGASISAILYGKCIRTTMGYTPL
jgi:hypothetical protein